jgi:hypothetical protein
MLEQHGHFRNISKEEVPWACLTLRCPTNSARSKIFEFEFLGLLDCSFANLFALETSQCSPALVTFDIFEDEIPVTFPFFPQSIIFNTSPTLIKSGLFTCRFAGCKLQPANSEKWFPISPSQWWSWYLPPPLWLSTVSRSRGGCCWCDTFWVWNIDHVTHIYELRLGDLWIDKLELVDAAMLARMSLATTVCLATILQFVPTAAVTIAARTGVWGAVVVKIRRCLYCIVARLWATLSECDLSTFELNELSL